MACKVDTGVKFTIYSRDQGGDTVVLAETENPAAVDYVWTALRKTYPEWAFWVKVKHGRTVSDDNLYAFDPTGVQKC